MARGDETGGGADFLDVGRERHGGRWSRWLLVPIGVVVAAVGIVQATHTDGPRPSALPTSRAAPATIPPSAESPVPPVVVTTLGHPLLGATTDWELLGRGAREVVRIELARGRITRTAVPALLSGAPVSFVVTADQALVRSIDEVPGYVVRDGQPARKMSARLGAGGPVFPGPDPGTVWVQSGDGARSVMVLRSVNGGPDRAAIPMPADNSLLEASADGAGYLILSATGGFYDATPAGLRRITTGSLLAVGATRWLALECDDRHRCQPVVIDRATRSRRAVRAALSDNVPRGVIAPDGATAAMFDVDGDGTVTARLLDLASGATRPIDLSIGPAAGDGVVWSPDSRWLIVAGADGTIRAVDPATAQVTPLGVSVAELSHLAVRPVRPG